MKFVVIKHGLLTILYASLYYMYFADLLLLPVVTLMLASVPPKQSYNNIHQDET